MRIWRWAPEWASGVSGVGSVMIAQAQAFISTVTGTLDSKGRVCIPADYRTALTAQETAGVYLCTSFLDSSIEGFGAARMQRLLAKQAEQDPVLGTDIDDLTRLTLGMTQLLPRDENGRVRLPESFIEHGGLTDRVVFVGEGESFRIWSPDAHAATREEQIKQARAIHAARRAGRAGEG